MKAYRTEANRIVFFRPEENARRMQAGADRLRMPPVPESLFVDAVEQVVHANRDWVPLRADEARSMCDPSSSARARCWVSHPPHRSRSWSIVRPWDRTSKEE